MARPKKVKEEIPDYYDRKKGKRILKVTPMLLKIVEEMAHDGMIQKHIYGFLGVSQSTWYEYLAKFPAISDAFFKGKSKGINLATKKMFEKIREGNVDMIKFFLQKRGNFDDTSEFCSSSEEKSKPSINLNVNITDPIEAAKIYQSVMNRS